MRPARERERLVQVARMYYLQELSQQEIAEALGTTRSNVSRILAAAREQGIVQIRVVETIDRDAGLEARLCDRFPLREARVLAATDQQDVLADVGKLGAEWLLDIVKRGQRIGVSWGSTLQAVVDSVPDGPIGDVEVVQLVGGLSALATKVSGQELARELSARLHCGYRYLHAPALFDSPAALRALQAESSIARALDAAREADVALVGIGAVGVGSSAEILGALGLTAAEKRAVERAGAVGDICARYFDAAGREVSSPAHDRVLGIDLDDLRAIPLVAGVAVGREKGTALAAAMTGGLLDIVICDEAAARTALEAAYDQYDGREPADAHQRRGGAHA